MVRRIALVVILLAIVGGAVYAYGTGRLAGIPNPLAFFAPSEFQINQAPQRSTDCGQTDPLYTLSAPEILLGLPVYLDLSGFFPNEKVDLSAARADPSSAEPVPAPGPSTSTRRFTTLVANQCGTLAVEIRATGDEYRGAWLVQVVGRESHKTIGIARFTVQ